jgi:hypothetical protein
VAFPEEVILHPPARTVAPQHARSTVVVGSIGVLRAQGLVDRYVSELQPEHREILLGAVAGMWLPIDVTLAHYRACDALGLPPDQQFTNGRATFDKAGGSLLGTMIRMAKEAGVTPWTIYPHFQRFWERAYDGGGVSVVKLGPKEARIHVDRFTLLESPYYRHALRGLVTAVVELFCSKAYLTERGARAPHAITWRAQWA